MIRIVVTGSKGRMGQRVSELVSMEDDLVLVAGVDIGDRLEDVIGDCDVVIDFTGPDAAAQHANTAASHSRPIVIGTTGLDHLQRGAVIDAARTVPVVFAPNMSIGVNLMLGLIDTAARTLGQGFRLEISETHHVHKKDRPSGTALRILDVAAKARGEDPSKDAIICREDEGADANIVVRSMRRGEVVGDHEITFVSPDECLAIGHHAANRDIFARGAMAAARWIVGRPAGLYGMDDVLGLKR